MLTCARAWARQIAGVMVVVVGALGVPHGADLHHDADGHALVVHDESAHRIGTPGDRGDEAHCLACHTARSFRFGVAAPAFGPPLPVASSSTVGSTPTPVGTPAAVQPPLRAPPSAPALA